MYVYSKSDFVAMQSLFNQNKIAEFVKQFCFVQSQAMIVISYFTNQHYTFGSKLCQTIFTDNGEIVSFTAQQI